MPGFPATAFPRKSVTLGSVRKSALLPSAWRHRQRQPYAQLGFAGGGDMLLSCQPGCFWLSDARWAGVWRLREEVLVLDEGLLLEWVGGSHGRS